MKLFIIFFLLFPVSYGYGQSSESEATFSEDKQSKKALTLLQNQLEQYVDSLMSVLLDEDTPRENQMEILNELRTIADVNGQITIALNQVSQSGLEQDHIDTSKAGNINENISVWAKNQAELIRRKQLALNELQKRDEELDKDFYVNLALDGIVILAGGVLFFVPAVGPALSIPLTVGRLTHITLTGQKLGALLMATGGVESGLSAWNYFFEEEEGVRVLSFVSSVALRDVLTRELFSILSSTNEREKYLAFNLLRAVDEETLINDLLNAIKDEKNSVEVRKPAIRSLRAFSNMDATLRKEAMDVLKEMIDESQIPTLRETSVSVLGEIGEGELEVAEYLMRENGINKNEDDKLRLLALTQLGRNQEYFPISIGILTDWFEDTIYKPAPLGVPLDIPSSFVTVLLLEKQERVSEEQLESHKKVVREFIHLDILDVGLKFRFSETLIRWDNSPDTKDLLRKAWANPAEDMGLYVKQLVEESLSDENYQAFEFLRTQIEELEKEVKNFNIPQEIALDRIKSVVEKFDKAYSNQKEITENLENFLNSYRKMQENIKN